MASLRTVHVFLSLPILLQAAGRVPPSSENKNIGIRPQAKNSPNLKSGIGKSARQQQSRQSSGSSSSTKAGNKMSAVQNTATTPQYKVSL